MAETFRCPSCSAPLEFEGKMMQKCRHCGSNVIVPSDVMRQSNSFGGSGFLEFGDLSYLTGKTLKVAEIQRELQTGSKIMAVKLYHEAFGVNLKEAKDAVEAMQRGESVEIGGTRIQTQTTTVQATHINSDAVKKAGIVAGSSILLTTIIILFFTFAVIGVVLFFTFSSVQKTTEIPQSQPPTKVETTAKAAEILKFGGEGNGAGKFTDNRVVAVDGNGKIYSGDYQGGKIQVFDASGKFLTQWIADAKMNFYDMIADRKGTVYIAQNKGVFAFEGESGKLLYKNENIRPQGLALLPDGKIAATNDRGFSILDAELNKLKDFKDANETANIPFGFEQIAADGDGGIYMITQTDNYVCKFNSDGKFIDRFKIENASNGIAVDNQGRIFVSNTSEINVYDAEGKSLESFGTTQAFGMAFNDAGELFIASRPFVTKYKLNF